MKIYRAILLLGLLWSSLAVAEMNPDFDTEFPSESIGIDILAYPELDVVPGYPVYYAPRLDFNYFFYDGLYWLYQDDTWYTGSWYDGPWWMVGIHPAHPCTLLQSASRLFWRVDA